MADVKKIKVVIGTDTSELEKGMDKASKKVSRFGQEVKKLGGLIAGAFAIDRIARFNKEAFMLSATMQGVFVAFQRIAQPGLLDDLKKATHGTVSELELMKRAVMASNFRIPLDQLATLLKFATKRAQETGESVDYLVNSIVIGIGRKSPLILDNLGISAVELRQKLENVGHSGATVMDVAKAVGEIAAQEMAKAGDIIETAAIKTERWAAAFQNVKTEFGDFLRGSTEADKKLRDWNDWLSENLLYYFFYDANRELRETIALQDELHRKALEQQEKNKRQEPLDPLNLFGNLKFTGEERLAAGMTLVKQWGLTTFKPIGLWAISFAIADMKAEAEAAILPVQRLNESLDWIRSPFGNMFDARGARLASQAGTQKAAEGVLANISANMNSDIEAVTETAAKLGNTIGVQLVTRFASLGDAIGRALSGAEDALNSLGQAILQNLGSILMMAGLQAGPAGIGLVIAGAMIQMGSGIWRGMQGGQSTPSAVSGVNHTFTLKGRDLQSALDLNREYNQG